MRHISVSQVSGETPENVSPETSHIRLLLAPTVSPHSAKSVGQTRTSESSHLSRIYALLDEDLSRKPADIQCLTGISKATVYRLVERYHREHPVSETAARDETETDEAIRNEIETAS